MGIERFYKPQQASFRTALQEIRRGKKTGHWMWYIFPQIKGLGKTETSKFYALEDLGEAELWLKDEFLGKNLRQITAELLDVNAKIAAEIFGFPDDRKLQSSMTLFSAAEGSRNNIFEKVLNQYFGGEKCAFTAGALAKKV